MSTNAQPPVPDSLFVVQRKWTDNECAIGEMFYQGVHECFTLEPPCRPIGIKPRCIPAGTYLLTIAYSPKHGRDVPFVNNVPDFTEVEIHWGNYSKDTLACTLVGETRGTDFIGHSKAEFDILFKKIQAALQLGPQTITYIDQPEVVN